MTFFDLRLPLGWLFVILGALLVGAGFWSPVTSQEKSLGVNIDLIWGGVMIVFGAICLWFARWHARKHAERSSRPRK